jgi:hypothetical protein
MKALILRATVPIIRNQTAEEKTMAKKESKAKQRVSEFTEQLDNVFLQALAHSPMLRKWEPKRSNRS